MNMYVYRFPIKLNGCCFRQGVGFRHPRKTTRARNSGYKPTDTSGDESHILNVLNGGSGLQRCSINSNTFQKRNRSSQRSANSSIRKVNTHIISFC